jgi:hypothetical protein
MTAKAKAQLADRAARCARVLDTAAEHTKTLSEAIYGLKLTGAGQDLLTATTQIEAHARKTRKLAEKLGYGA